MIVDNVEYNSDAQLMTGVHELFQANRTAIRALHSIRIDAVIAPVAIARETSTPSFPELATCATWASPQSNSCRSPSSLAIATGAMTASILMLCTPLMAVP